MKFWIDETSQHENVVVFIDSAIIIGSVDKEGCQLAREQLDAKKSPIEVLGSSDLLTIPYIQIHSIESRDTEDSISLKFKAKKELEDQELNFSDVAQKQQAIKVLKLLLPDNLKMKVQRQSPISASISPLFSLLIAIWCVHLFIDKLRWVAIIVGGVWALGSAYTLYSRFTEPPEITRWTIKGKYARKTWHSIKTAFALLVLAAIVTSVHRKFPDVYGEASLYQHIQEEDWQDESVAYFVNNGANVNYLDTDGDSLLWIAVSYDDVELVRQLLDAGADPTYVNGDGYSPLGLAVSNDYQESTKLILNADVKFKDLNQVFAEGVNYGSSHSLLKLLLDKGADVNFEVEPGQSVLVRAIQDSLDTEMVKFLIDNGANTSVTVGDQNLIVFIKENNRTELLELLKINVKNDL